ncbi:glycogen synthase [Colwellia sp. D2M02]|uniref:glycogen synthase n=1 Tax=Colwellia sp. D2M02 TaxID=2841562 RepID=UPI001C08C67A|nr:glycogen/starch synthase [Colwellia sp. D2M02]MBU2893395.1 glycogen synthase [Colwellia sp. D2M02]
MQILMVAAENDAIVGAKVGGIGDVVRDTPQALAEQGHHVSVIIPDYANYEQLYSSEVIADFSVPFAGKLEAVIVRELFLDNPSKITTQVAEGNTKQGSVRQFVLSHQLFTAQGIGRVYLDDPSDRPFACDATKYALFNAAILEALLHGHIQPPEVLHLHDWHSALTTILLAYADRYRTLANIRCVYTVHNLALQGIRPLSGDESSLEAWFGSLSYDGQHICDPRYPHCVNPMRAAINLSHKVHLVSPSYAQEVLKPSDESRGVFGGEGLEHDLQRAHSQGRLFGILNGCYYENLSPTTNNLKHTEKIIEPKEKLNTVLSVAKQELLLWVSKTEQLQSSHYLAVEQLNTWLSYHDFTGPLVTSVGRLTNQKMLLLRKSKTNDSSVNALGSMLVELDKVKGCLIVLGSGDQDIAAEFTQLMAQHRNFLFLNGYGQAVTDQLYEQGDLFLMPSSFEPCGISQMLALRAGQPCLVNAVGGLKDTIQHLENGFVFQGESITEQQEQLVNVFEQALHLYVNDNLRWQQLVNGAKNSRFSWQESITQYLQALYQA